MDLAFDSNHSAVGNNKLVELYSEKPESSPPYGDPFQTDIPHDGYGSQGEGGKNERSCHEANAFPS